MIRSVGIQLGHVHLRNRQALGHRDFQSAGQNAIDGNGLNFRNEFEVSFDGGQIEADQVSRPASRPPSGAIVPAQSRRRSALPLSWMANVEFS